MPSIGRGAGERRDVPDQALGSSWGKGWKENTCFLDMDQKPPVWMWLLWQKKYHRGFFRSSYCVTHLFNSFLSCTQWKTEMEKVLELKRHPSSPVASTGPPTDFHGIRWDPGETAGHTIQMVRCECSWLVSSGILWGGGSSGEPTPAPPAGFWERHKGYMCCLPPEITSLGTPMPSGHAQLPWGGGDQWPMAQPTWNMKRAPWPSAQGAWEDGSRRVLARGSGDLETEFFHYGTSCLLVAYRRIRNRCPLFQEDASAGLQPWPHCSLACCRASGRTHTARLAGQPYLRGSSVLCAVRNLPTCHQGDPFSKSKYWPVCLRFFLRIANINT